MMDNKYNEWRILTPILLSVISISGVIIGYLAIDKINTITAKTDKAFGVISGVKTSFDDYRVSAEGRFARLETKIDGIIMRNR